MEVHFKDFVLNCSKTEISEKRKNLLKQIDGDVFYCLSLWPRNMERIFWSKPIVDQDTFKLLIFLVENGCPPWMATQWILTSTFWDKTKTLRRFYQMQWIVANLANNRKTWFYFDLHFNKYVYLDGTDRYVNEGHY